MTKSRKLSIAGLLVAGGYLAASVLGGAAELALPAADAESALAGDPVKSPWLDGLKSWIPEREVASSAGELVPEGVHSLGARLSSPTITPAGEARPTWLDASSEQTVPALAASHPSAAAAPLTAQAPLAPQLNDFQTSRQAADPMPPIRALDPPPEAPKARITAVRVASAESVQQPASPWDRWPRLPASEVAVKEGAVPATFQDLSTLSPGALSLGNSASTAMTFHQSEMVRKNSPQRDPGAAPPGALRTHVVIDGDTLNRLADRYLDDPARSAEIYRLNRDLLTNPELLPIGVELRIPERDVGGDAMALLPHSEGIASAEPRLPQGMVPVQWTPKAFDESPRAQLLQPIPAGHGD